MSRFLASIKYKIQTDSIKENIIPKLDIKKEKEGLVYASEADLLNLALFGKTAKNWRNENPDLAKKGNIRDFASITELIILSSLESANAKMIADNIAKEQRLEELNKQAIREMQSFSQIQRIANNQNSPLKKAD